MSVYTYVYHISHCIQCQKCLLLFPYCLYLYIYIGMVYPVGLLCMYMCKCVYIYIWWLSPWFTCVSVNKHYFIWLSHWFINLMISPLVISGNSLPVAMWHLGQESFDILQLCLAGFFSPLGFSINGGTPKWMVCFMENPSINGWFRDTPHDKTETSIFVLITQGIDWNWKTLRCYSTWLAGKSIIYKIFFPARKLHLSGFPWQPCLTTGRYVSLGYTWLIFLDSRF